MIRAGLFVFPFAFAGITLSAAPHDEAPASRAEPGSVAAAASLREPVTKSGPAKTILAKSVNVEHAPSTHKQFLDEIKKQTGFMIDVPPTIAENPLGNSVLRKGTFWEVVESVASASGCQVVVGEQGRKLKLVPRAAGRLAAPSAVDGPYRVVVRQVIGKRDFETGQTSCEIHLDLHWEPRFPLFFVDAEPKVLAVLSNDKYKIQPGPRAEVRSAVTGFTHPLVVRMTGVPREVRKIDELVIRVAGVAAGRFLPFVFDLPSGDKASPAVAEQEGVNVTLRPARISGPRVEVTFDLRYPENQTQLESFQQFTADNKLRIVSPDGRTRHETTDYNTEESGRNVRATYSFTNKLPNNLAGWKVEYETPSPLLEVTATFTLKDILLP